MAPYQSPFADPVAVQKIINDFSRLAISAVDIEEGIDKAKREAVEVARKYQADFDILTRLPVFFDEFANDLQKKNNTARDVAIKTSTPFDEFVLILDIVGTVKTKEEVLEIVGALKNDLKITNPLDSTPLDGFRGVTNEFNHIWTLKLDETKYIIDVLEKATDIKKTTEKLATELNPVKEGVEKVQKALRAYASHIHN